MKPPNQEVQALAEVVEGRALVKENSVHLARVRHSEGNACPRDEAGCVEFWRPVSAIRTVCGNAACTGLCGGRPAMTVPTATPLTLLRKGRGRPAS